MTPKNEVFNLKVDKKIRGNELERSIEVTRKMFEKLTNNLNRRLTDYTGYKDELIRLKYLKEITDINPSIEPSFIPDFFHLFFVGERKDHLILCQIYKTNAIQIQKHYPEIDLELMRQNGHISVMNPEDDMDNIRVLNTKGIAFATHSVVLEEINPEAPIIFLLTTEASRFGHSRPDENPRFTALKAMYDNL